jgi:hypothetical protein
MILNFLLFSVLCGYVLGNYQFPLCTDMMYTPSGTVDVEQMLYACSKNTGGSMFPPSLFAGLNSSFSHPATIVNVSLAFNAVVEIDDVHATVTLDFWFRQYWKDPRWKFPTELWKQLSSVARYEGLELVPYVREGDPTLNFWLPDTYILESISHEVQAEMIHLFQNSDVWWSKHIVIVIKQGLFDLRKYPIDHQQFTLTLQSWAYATQFVKLRPFEIGPPPVVFNDDPTLGKKYIDLDPLWTFVSSQVVVKDQYLPSFFDPYRNFTTVSFYLNFKRESYGIIFRLALPILMFLLIVGFAFWADIQSRIEVTITMLLAVSAFYLIIGQIIPFVGYFSLLDKFITTAFCVLSGAAGIHYMTYNLDAEKYKYPMNELFRDSVVYLSRLLWAPVILGIGFSYFNTVLDGAFSVLFIFILIITSVNTLIHSDEIAIVFRKKLCQLRVKHYYKAKQIHYLEDCTDENMLKGENVVVIDLTFVEVLIYSLTTYFRVRCACEVKWCTGEVKTQTLLKSLRLRFLEGKEKEEANVLENGEVRQFLSRENSKNKIYPETNDGMKYAATAEEDRPVRVSEKKKYSGIPDEGNEQELGTMSLTVSKKETEKEEVELDDAKDRSEMIDKFWFWCEDVRQADKILKHDKDPFMDNGCGSRFCCRCSVEKPYFK